MKRATKILLRFEEHEGQQTVTQLLESVNDINERDKLTHKLVVGQLPREAEFWNLTIVELTKITGLRPPSRGAKVHDLIMWITRSANRWRESIFYQNILDKDAKKRDKNNNLTWVSKRR